MMAVSLLLSAAVGLLDPRLPVAGLSLRSAPRAATPLMVEDDRERRTGRRIGGWIPRQPPNAKDSGTPTARLLGTGVALLVLRGLLFGGGGDASFVYSVSTYSETTVLRATDGRDGPRYETKSQSSFSTNVPGLAERLAEQQSKQQGTLPYVERFPTLDLFP